MSLESLPTLTVIGTVPLPCPSLTLTVIVAVPERLAAVTSAPGYAATAQGESRVWHQVLV